jgi:hypothetical protein
MTSMTSIKAATPRPVPEPGTPFGWYQEGEDMYIGFRGFHRSKVTVNVAVPGEVRDFTCLTSGGEIQDILDSICCIL